MTSSFPALPAVPDNLEIEENFVEEEWIESDDDPAGLTLPDPLPAPTDGSDVASLKRQLKLFPYRNCTFQGFNV